FKFFLSHELNSLYKERLKNVRSVCHNTKTGRCVYTTRKKTGIMGDFNKKIKRILVSGCLKVYKLFGGINHTLQ
ncbi:hypothetical protein, partial [Kingella kingae]|uniref:hypothetical protein n=1 Tax=Kingella kingae TaxID=504 RepID=UPI001E5F5D40